jgi:endonuclease G
MALARRTVSRLLALMIVFALAAAALVTLTWRALWAIPVGLPTGTSAGVPHPSAALSAPEESPHLALGAPVGPAGADTLVLRPEYALAYDRARHGANWVAWRLDSGDLGPAERYRGHFLPEPGLPPDEAIVHADYDGTGFDRGHLVPSGDRTSTPEAQAATFLLGNVLPQRPALNRGPWEALEKYMRRLAKQGLRVFVATGPLWGPHPTTLGAHLVPVPSAFWKVGVIVCGSCGVEAVDAATPTVAVVMPNEDTVGPRWMSYRTTIAEVEQRSGYALLGRVPAATRAALRTRLDAEQGR